MPEALTHYTSWEIAAIIDKTTMFKPHYLESFGMVHTTDKKTIDFEEVADDRRIAPFVSPYVQGKAARRKGSTMNAFEAGYIKDMVTINPDDTFNRTVGEQPVGNMSGQQRLEAAMVREVNKVDVRFNRRLEVMASQLLINGYYVMEGESFPSVEVNFKRDAANTYSPAAGSRWGESGVSPIDDVEDMTNRFRFPVTRLTFGSAAFKKFKTDPKYKDLINLDFSAQLAGNSELPLGPMQHLQETVMYVGRLSSMNNVPMYIDNRTYEDNDGTVMRYTGEDQVVFETAASEGWRCFARIQNILAELKSQEKFWRAWTTTESSLPGHFAQLESAPMLAHTEINSTGVINTLG